MPRRIIPVAASIGERIKARRELRGWSIRHAASRAGIAHTTWMRIERGLIRTDRYLVFDLATALECSVADLTGQPHIPGDRALDLAHARVQDLWRVLVEIAPDEPPSRGPSETAALVDRVGLVSELRLASDYAGVVQMLPELLIDLHSSTFGPDPRGALRLLVDATHNAMLALRHLGYTAEPTLAGERCRQAAERLDEPVALALADWVRAHMAFASGSASRALSLTARNIDFLGAHAGERTASEVLGMLHLTSAVAALPRDVDGARAHVGEARRLAEVTGESSAWTLGFGPTNVAVWAMTTEIDAGEPAQALAVGIRLDLDRLSTARRGSYYVEMSRALGDLGRDDEAVRMLLVAERTAPQLTRSSTAARESARYLLDKSRRGTSELRGLCERMGVSAT